MKKLITATATSLLVLAGCASDPDETEAPTSTTSSSTSSNSTTTTAPTTSESPDLTPEPAPEPAVASVPVAPAPAASPSFVRCYLADGTALMSDGTTIYLDSCNESAGGPYLLEDGSPAITYSPEDFADASYWSNCIEAGNTSEYCTANDPN